jgi:hypothetical protein
MNLLKTIVLAGALAVSSTAFAQFAGSGNSSSSASTGNDVTGYSRFGVSYTNTSYDFNKEAGDLSISLDGVSIDYLHGFSVSQTMPLFFEVGVNANYAVGSKYDMDYTSINAQVPLNLAYRYPVSDNLAIMPYVGLNAKFGIQLKAEYDGDDTDLYSEDDMGDDNAFNRFQLGWHIGAGVQINKFYVGLQYGTDFTPAYKNDDAKVNTADFKLSVAYCF